MIFILQMKKLRQTEVKCLAQDHTGRKYPRLDLNLGLLDFRSSDLSTEIPNYP